MYPISGGQRRSNFFGMTEGVRPQDGAQDEFGVHGGVGCARPGVTVEFLFSQVARQHRRHGFRAGCPAVEAGRIEQHTPRSG